MNFGNPDPSKLVITDVYDETTFSIPNDPLYEGKSIYVLFNSINHSGSGANHCDVVYRL